jgi:hypothetical protein
LGILLASFAVFCVIVFFVVTGVRYFLFQSRVPLHSTVQVARGTATLIGADMIEQSVRGSRDFSGSSVLTTDTQTQASIAFRDPQQADKLIATITLKNGSSLNLQHNSRPRFDLSGDPYWIDFEDAYGEFDVFVPDALDRPILISVETTLGPSARLTGSGRYTLVAAGGGQVQVVNYSGEALLISSDMRSNQPVPSGQSASMEVATEQAAVMPSMVNLLGDSTFSTNNVIGLNDTGDQSRITLWRCNDAPNAPPPGAFGLTVEEGRPALHLFRADGAESHGVTLCFQGFGSGTQGLDISMFSRITLRATFKITSQSLSACGADGSECPMMLRMDYYPPAPVPTDGSPPDADGRANEPKTWIHGFYASVDPNRLFPLRCASCNEDHEQINAGTWYTYESRNFLESFAQDQRPLSILNLRFDASGHQYDVYVSEIALLVDSAQMPANDTIGS